MAVATREVPSDLPTLSKPRPGRRRRWTRWILPSYTTLVMLYLVSPILVMILYSFNNSGFKKVSFKWLGFTARWYPRVFDKPDLTAALKNSLLVATISTVIATALGTLIALALVRYQFRGRSAADFVLFMNISAPEIVLGASLLSLFIPVVVPRA